MNTLTTIAYELKTKKVLLENGHKIKVKIWDTAGQERFEKVALQYVVHAQGIYLVYDITDKNSFNQIEHWVELANQKVDVTWTMSKEGIVTVTGTTVRCVSAGTVTLTASYGEQTFTCVITVK
jgi:GTPase SAR1 family protein